ncbi:MAG TPA: bifunctional YncE family protein/alkaline phosphatase family protein [Parafilimonas sp.]|nr:bifunctional YncE family protein/alkaline phosphatase family protein [Parafilimonas sp.]
MHRNIRHEIFALIMLLASCTASHSITSTPQSSSGYHSFYDDDVLSASHNPVLLPYNRFLKPAGTVIKFGDGDLENHSLDCVTIPGENVIATEDRFGLTFINVPDKKVLYHLTYKSRLTEDELMSTYSGLKAVIINDKKYIFWGAANLDIGKSYIIQAEWNGKSAMITDTFSFPAIPPSTLALPNDISIRNENGEYEMYVVLNGNNLLEKIRLSDKKIIWTTQTGMAPFGIALVDDKAYVTNWGGPKPTDTTLETAGIPYGKVYIDPVTGATALGSVSVIDTKTGNVIKEIQTGLHPNAIIVDQQKKFLYVSNGNSDNISVINCVDNVVTDSVSVKLNPGSNMLIGDSPNALALDSSGNTLYVANGMDNALAVIHLGENISATGNGKTFIQGFIPTEAYPSGIVIFHDSLLFVANLEGEGSGVEQNKAYNVHHQLATVSIIPIPGQTLLDSYTKDVQQSNMLFRTKISELLPRPNMQPVPVPQRIGEPSVFKHVLYIIKENRTYDQILGDMKEGNGMASLCNFGDSVTPNQHALARQFLLLDNYYVSGKSSAEGHQWADAAITTDYVEKNVRAWFRSYPHVQTDALVYDKNGFIWNDALDHGKSVRIYGEACIPVFDKSLLWKDIYQLYKDDKPFNFKNVTTISRVRPILSDTYPGYDGHAIADQLRAKAFIDDLHKYEKLPGDQLPALMVIALPADHTAGMSPNFPTPRAMVADNDLALGKIVQAVSSSRFWDSTVIFVTEDDSQNGWDHVSAYRTTGFVFSAYSVMNKTIHTNYNQTCMVRTIEQILGIPPMNIIDATALPMFDCFTNNKQSTSYNVIANKIPLDEMNRSVSELNGKAKQYAAASMQPQYDHIDGGDDNLLNRIIWYSTMGKKPYPKQMTLQVKDDD